MSYKLKFIKSALKEWKKLDSVVKDQFKKQLKKRIENPCVEASRLKGYKNLYKIKLRSLGYRLAYLVNKSEISIIFISVGRRDKIYEVLKDTGLHDQHHPPCAVWNRGQKQRHGIENYQGYHGC